jgi:hypothetical protein
LAPMASLYRPTYTKPDPKTGGCVTRRVGKWYGKYRGAAGWLRCVPLCQNKTAAMAMLTDLVRRAELQRAGLIDPAAEHLARPIDEHFGDFKVHLEAKARSARYISGTLRIVGNAVAACIGHPTPGWRPTRKLAGAGRGRRAAGSYDTK